MLPPHRPLALRAGHAHVAIAGLARPLEVGGSFPLTLTFAKAGTIAIAMMVQGTPSD